jgi:hypothetical protein
VGLDWAGRERVQRELNWRDLLGQKSEWAAQLGQIKWAR